MPVLNDNKCYAEQPKRQAIVVPDDLRADWFVDFQEQLATQLKLNNTEKNREFYDHEAKKNIRGTEKEAFINEFDRHAGAKSTYSLKSQLLDSLRKLYCIYTDPKTNESQKYIIASRIREDITQCSPGFNNRVNFLLSLFELPNNFDELLAKARYDLVDKIARTYAQKNAQGVHVHSRFFGVAESRGYGVPSINKNDIYLHTGSSDLSDDDIEKILAEGFANRFGLFGIVSGLREQIENLMAMHGYKGKNNGEGSALYFYLLKVVNPFIDIKDNAELLETNDKTLTIDVNWQRVNLMLFKKLVEENYADLSPKEAALWANFPKSLKLKTLNSLIPNAYELARCLEFFSQWTIKRKTRLVMAYLKNKTAKEQEIILTTLDDQTPQITAQLKTQPDLQQIYYAIAIQKSDITAVKAHIEKGADINAALGLLFSGDHKSDTLYWLHDHKALLAAISADGMKAIILNGKYKGKTIAEALVSTRKGRQLLLENPDLQKLIPGNGWLHQVQEDQKKVVNVIEGFFKKPDPMATQLGQYIVYGDLDKAEAMLKANPTLVDKYLNEKVTVKDYSRRKQKGTAFQLALSAMDNEMCEMLAKYMNKDEIARQYQAVFPKGHKKYYAEQEPFDFTAIVDAISQGSDADVDKALDLELPNDTALWQKLEKFRTDFTDRSKSEIVFNPQHLIKAFELYNRQFDDWHWKQRDLFWRQVIGYTQRFLPANMAMVFAYGLYDVVENHENAPRSFKFRYGDGSIFPISSDSLSGVGYEFAPAGRPPAAAWRGAARAALFETYVKQKRQTIETYAAISRSKNLHDSVI